MSNNQADDRTLDAIKSIQQAVDDRTKKLRIKFNETNNKSLIWNLYVWFPLLQLASFFNLVKQAKGFDVKSLIGFLTTGTFLGVSISKIFGITTVVAALEKLHLNNVNWSVTGIILFAFWYLITLQKMQRKVVDVESKYFLYAAYRKYDKSYQLFSPLIETSSEVPDNLLEKTVERLLEAGGEVSVWQEKCIEAYEKNTEYQERIQEYQERIDDMNTRALLIDKRRTKQLERKDIVLKTTAGINRKLVEALVEHENIHYKHLDFMGVPFIVYKKVRNELVHEWSQGVIDYEKRIGIRKKTNFFVRVQDSQGIFVNDTCDKFMGLCVDVRNKKYVVAYQKNDMVKIHNSINSVEVVATVQAILSQMK